MDDEIWTTRDGERIKVGDMSEEHVRNVLRMLLRNRRVAAEQTALRSHWDEEALGVDPQDIMNAQYREDLRNPNIYFPLLGCHGSEELYRKHSDKI